MSMSSDDTFTIKLEKGSDIRRLSGVTLGSIYSLNAQCSQAYYPEYYQKESLKAINAFSDDVPFLVKYKDEDGDLITITSDEDLEEAKRLMTANGNKILRFTVVIKEEFEERKTRVLSEAFSSRFQKNGAIHPALCDVCSNRIIGIRFKCLVCSNYDLCQGCVNKEGHPMNHSFMEIHRPVIAQSESPYSKIWKRPVDGDYLVNPTPSNIHRTSSASSGAEDEDISQTLESISISLEQKKQKTVSDSDSNNNNQLGSNVSDTAPSSTEAAPSSAQQTISIEDHLKHLNEMGFLDREENFVLLVKHGLNLEQAVRELLEQQ